MKRKVNYLKSFIAADKWIKKNTIMQKGIAVTSRQRRIYPEVTGYYIPTLLRWGYRELALNYARYLCTIQTDEGAWCAFDKKTPYVFDTAQIIKGLLAVVDILPEIEKHIILGCDWIISNIQKEGRLTTPSVRYWNNESVCSELIHLYCLSPLMEAAKRFNRLDYEVAAKKVANYYITNRKEEIVNFNILSHFYAYIMEALVDIGEIELVEEAMNKIEKLQGKDGRIPAYKDVKWICSTGIFQFAVVWYKLGKEEPANKAFEYALSLQNVSGGWFGGYSTSKLVHKINKRDVPTYFPNEEISWVIKYFLDALYYKLVLNFENCAGTFNDYISKNDGRYQLILKEIESANANIIADLGCGKGRYLKNLTDDLQNIQGLYGIDVSMSVMKGIKKEIVTKQGSLLQIPYKEQYFDFIFTAEVLEHAIHIPNAIKEMVRVTKIGGMIVVIDKNKEKAGKLDISPWEQWFEPEKLKKIFVKLGCEVRIIENISYENKRDGLFIACIAKKIR